MLTSLISLLVVALVLYLIWYVVSMFMPGQPAQIIGIILGLILLLYALQVFGILSGVPLLRRD